MPEYSVTISLKPLTITADDPGAALGEAAAQVSADVLGNAAHLAVVPKDGRLAGFELPSS